MSPKVQRGLPPYLQIVEHYREQIRDGTVSEGDQLPPARQVAEEWGVAPMTVAKAMRQLQTEGLITTSNKGAFVAYHEANTYTPQDRLRAMRKTGRIYPPSERARVLAAEVISAPEHVAIAMGIETGNPVIRRERITYHGETPVTASVSWIPGDLASQVPELLSTERIPGGTVGRIREVTGRTVAKDRYRECARRATESDAEALGVTIGDPVLFGQNTWYEADGTVLEFGEFTIPNGRWLTVEGER